MSNKAKICYHKLKRFLGVRKEGMDLIPPVTMA
jgi:hypothetical protein